MSEWAFEQVFKLQSRQLRERRLCLQADALALREKAAAEQAEHERVWARLEQSQPDRPPDSYPRLVLPSGPRREEVLARHRRRRYHEHLKRVIAEATVPTPSPVPSPATPQAVTPQRADPAAGALAGQLCTLCAGGCCASGGDTAYLGAATLRRVMAQHPALSPREVLTRYLAHLPRSNQAGSCVNHGDRGCTLPREMRSDVCNDFFCRVQQGLADRFASERPAPRGVIAIVRQQDQWHRDTLAGPNPIIAVAVVTAAGITPLNDEGAGSAPSS